LSAAIAASGVTRVPASIRGREVVELDLERFRDTRHHFERAAVLAGFEIGDMRLRRLRRLRQLGLRQAALGAPEGKRGRRRQQGVDSAMALAWARASQRSSYSSAGRMASFSPLGVVISLAVMAAGTLFVDRTAGTNARHDDLGRRFLEDDPKISDPQSLQGCSPQFRRKRLRIGGVARNFLLDSPSDVPVFEQRGSRGPQKDDPLHQRKI
jgi:hypothetical protein